MNSNTINDYITECGNTAREKGFWDAHLSLDPITSATYAKLCLIHSELSEAVEELREQEELLNQLKYDTSGKPIGFASEIADVAIRLFDLCAFLDIDLNLVLQVKAEYNRNRPKLHGRKS